MNNNLQYRLFDVPLQECDLCFFDLEVTRLDLKAEIIEIGAVRVEPKEFKIKGEFEMKIKPQRLDQADPEGLAISGYNENDWREALDLEIGIKKFLEFVDGSVLVANNLPFDWMWLQKAIEDLQLKPTYFFKGLDIFSLAWIKLEDKQEVNNLSLKELAGHFNIDMGKHHRAIDDARTAYQIFLKLME